MSLLATHPTSASRWLFHASPETYTSSCFQRPILVCFPSATGSSNSTSLSSFSLYFPHPRCVFKIRSTDFVLSPLTPPLFQKIFLRLQFDFPPFYFSHLAFPFHYFTPLPYPKYSSNPLPILVFLPFSPPSSTLDFVYS